MEQTQYLEITSSRRNRKEHPLPAQFEIPLSQSGQKLAIEALDPVSISCSDVQWLGNTFNARQSALNPMELVVELEDVTLTGSGTEIIGNSSSPLTLIVNTTTTLTTSGRGSMHTIENYYRGAVAALGDGRLASSDRSRIIEYVYLGDDQAKMVFESTFTNALKPGLTLFYIVDPTALDAPAYKTPYFFVPTSPSISNAYNKYNLYNQTRCQSRPINSYDRVTHLVGVDTNGSTSSTPSSGPITSWTARDRYSIRRRDPDVCITALGGSITTTKPSFRSFNLKPSDAATIGDPLKLAGSFLEVQQNKELGFLIFQGGGDLTTTVQLGIASNPADGYYNGGIIRVLSGGAQGQLATIETYNGTTKIAKLVTGFSVAVAAGDTYDLSLPQQARRITKYVDYQSNAVGGTTTTLNFPVVNTSNNNHPFYINNYYNDLYIDVPTRGGIRLITNYTVTLDNVTGTPTLAVITIDPTEPAFIGAIQNGDAFTITSGVVSGGLDQFTYSISSQPAYILPYTYDNLYPFINAQSQIANAQQWYELELINLILPNQVLDSGFGSLISFYQYVYVEIENSNGSGTSGSNNIISNNSNAVGMTFRATIDDVPNPVNSTFIKIDGDGMTQTVRFDPQDNLKFSVYLGTGSNPNEKELFKVLPKEHFSPCPPNPLIQISAMFSVKKVVLKKDVLAQNAR
jgi:hypothetical protein